MMSITPLHVAGTKPSSLNGSISETLSMVLKSSSADEDAFVIAILCGATVVMAAAATMTAKMTVNLQLSAKVASASDGKLTRRHSPEFAL
jgi:hypothetical protein